MGPNDSQELTREELRELRRLLREDEQRRRDVRELWLAVMRWGVGAVLTALVGVMLLGVKAWLDRP